jgi:hypothetical protein
MKVSFCPTKEANARRTDNPGEFFGWKGLKDVEARGHFVFVALADGYLVPK